MKDEPCEVIFDSDTSLDSGSDENTSSLNSAGATDTPDTSPSKRGSGENSFEQAAKPSVETASSPKSQEQSLTEVSLNNTDALQEYKSLIRLQETTSEAVELSSDPVASWPSLREGNAFEGAHDAIHQASAESAKQEALIQELKKKLSKKDEALEESEEAREELEEDLQSANSKREQVMMENRELSTSFLELQSSHDYFKKELKELEEDAEKKGQELLELRARLHDSKDTNDDSSPANDDGTLANKPCRRCPNLEEQKSQLEETLKLTIESSSKALNDDDILEDEHSSENPACACCAKTRREKRKVERDLSMALKAVFKYQKEATLWMNKAIWTTFEYEDDQPYEYANMEKLLMFKDRQIREQNEREEQRSEVIAKAENATEAAKLVEYRNVDLARQVKQLKGVIKSQKMRLDIHKDQSANFFNIWRVKIYRDDILRAMDQEIICCKKDKTWLLDLVDKLEADVRESESNVKLWQTRFDAEHVANFQLQSKLEERAKELSDLELEKDKIRYQFQITDGIHEHFLQIFEKDTKDLEKARDDGTEALCELSKRYYDLFNNVAAPDEHISLYIKGLEAERGNLQQEIEAYIEEIAQTTRDRNETEHWIGRNAAFEAGEADVAYNLHLRLFTAEDKVKELEQKLADANPQQLKGALQYKNELDQAQCEIMRLKDLVEGLTAVETLTKGKWGDWSDNQETKEDVATGLEDYPSEPSEAGEEDFNSNDADFDSDNDADVDEAFRADRPLHYAAREGEPDERHNRADNPASESEEQACLSDLIGKAIKQHKERVAGGIAAGVAGPSGTSEAEDAAKATGASETADGPSEAAGEEEGKGNGVEEEPEEDEAVVEDSKAEDSDEPQEIEAHHLEALLGVRWV